MSEEAYRDMMVAGGRPATWGRDEEKNNGAQSPLPLHSHVPAIGARWTWQGQRAVLAEVFAGYEFSRRWMKDNPPDVVFLVNNDHATAFSWTSSRPSRSAPPGNSRWPRGRGPAPRADVQGAPELASHIAHSVIQQDFDLTIVNRMDVDHGLTVPLSLSAASPRMAFKVIPFAVNVVQYPVPSGMRSFRLGQRSAGRWRASTRT